MMTVKPSYFQFATEPSNTGCSADPMRFFAGIHDPLQVLPAMVFPYDRITHDGHILRLGASLSPHTAVTVRTQQIGLLSWRYLATS